MWHSNKPKGGVMDLLINDLSWEILVNTIINKSSLSL